MPIAVTVINQVYETEGNIVGKISARQDRTILDTGVKGASGIDTFGEEKTVLSQRTWVTLVFVPL